MKKIYFTLMIIVAGSFAVAQDFEFTNADYQVSAAPSDAGAAELVAHIDVTNISGEALDVECERINMPNYQEGASNRFCWGGLCWFPNTDVSPDSQPMAADETVVSNGDDGFTGYYNYMGDEGVSSVRYCFRDVNNGDIQTCVVVDYCVADNCATLLGIEDLDLQGTLGTMSPNPIQTSSSFSYSLQGANNAQINVYSLTGELVKSLDLTSNAGIVVVNSDDFETGIYFYALEANGQTIAMRKMIVAQ